MRNFVIINGCPTSIVASTPYHFLNHKKNPFLSHNYIFLSLSKPISLTPPSCSSSSNFNQTKDIDSMVLKYGKFSHLTSNFDGFLGLRKGQIKDCLAQLKVDFLRNFDGFFMDLIKQECFKNLEEVFYLLVVLELLKIMQGFKFTVGNLKPSDLIKTSIGKYNPRLAVRKEVHKGNKRVKDRGGKGMEFFDRRGILLSSLGSIALSTTSFSTALAASSRSDYADMPALRGKDYGKTKMRYPDYTETETGLQFKDLRTGSGPTPKIGDTVVVDWDGYTIGYYGRIFEARNKTKGGSFEGDDKDFFKFRIGSQEVIPAFEEAVVGMSLGGVRRIIVPPELGYPGNDYNQKGPRPTTFSGQRALDFVLRNQGLIDKTLLFDIELLKIIPN